MTTKLTWTGSPDDMTARSGEYVLHAWEEMKGFCIWEVFLGGSVIEGGSHTDIMKAKAAAIAAMNEHLKKK